MLSLADVEPLAVGQMRYVYRHPDRADALIKVIRPDMLEQRWGGARNWLKRRARARQYTVYLRELREYVALRARDALASPIVRVYGVIETDLGLGQVVEYLQGEDGGLAPTLEQLVARHGDAPWIRQGVDGLFASLLEHHVVLSDMHAGNIVHGRSDYDVMRFALVDGFGEKNAVPLCSMSAAYNARNTRRMYRKLMLEYGALVGVGSSRPQTITPGGS